MRLTVPCGLLLILANSGAHAQNLKSEPLKEGTPATLAVTLKESLEIQGYRVFLEGKPLVDLWFRALIPATSPPAGPTGSVRYPFLQEGELLGVAQYLQEGQDFRDQVIEPGLYTLRYGHRLDDGNHANVSPYKDYALLLPAEKDKELAPLAVKVLQKTSALAAGTTHPAILNLGDTPTSNASAPGTLRKDEEGNTVGILVPLKFKVAGKEEPSTQWIQLIVSGASAG